MEARWAGLGIDTAVPNIARMYDYWLGGTGNFAADRETAERALAAWPSVRTSVRENRALLGRAVRYLAAEAGINQFLDIGSGLPNIGNVHEVAQAVNPVARVVYVDNDPVVALHGKALLASGRDVVALHADLTEPSTVLGASRPAAGAGPEPTRRADLCLLAALRSR